MPSEISVSPPKERGARATRRHMLKTAGLISAAIAASTLVVPVRTTEAQMMVPDSKAGELRTAMRKLWEDHITWTRVFIISAVADLPDAGTAAGRLLQNQSDIGDAIKPVYGDAAGDKLTDLLREHILGAAALLTAAKAGETDAMNQASEAWYTNADDIATFLSGANPRNWPLDGMKAMMKEHLDLTLEEAIARLQGDWDKDVAAYDKIHDQILSMADMLTAGIVAQFPEKFR